jgi:hypothetical protein
LQNRLIQTSQTGGQRYSDTSPLSVPWLHPLFFLFTFPCPLYALKRTVPLLKFMVTAFEKTSKKRKNVTVLKYRV